MPKNERKHKLVHYKSGFEAMGGFLQQVREERAKLGLPERESGSSNAQSSSIFIPTRLSLLDRSLSSERSVSSGESIGERSPMVKAPLPVDKRSEESSVEEDNDGLQFQMDDF